MLRENIVPFGINTLSRSSAFSFEKISGIYSNENNGFSILFWVILLPVEGLRARFINVNKLKMSDILKTEAFRKYKNDLKVDNNHYSIDCSHG